MLIPHPINYQGLLLAFQQCAEDATDREIATALNNAGYRTDSIKRGANPFTKDTVRRILINPFYLGYVTYKGRRIDGKHPALIDPDLWDKAQATRIMNRKSPKTPSEKRFAGRVYPLSGLLKCQKCGGRMHGSLARSRALYRCYTRSQRKDACAQPYVDLGILEGQIGQYLQHFHLPEDYQKRILESAGHDWDGIRNVEQTQASLHL